jgi:hypothetical protein
MSTRVAAFFGIVLFALAGGAAGCDFIEDIIDDIHDPDPGPAPQCRSDADCRAFSFMCTGCDCLALGPNDREPVCQGPGVQCLVDPCLNKRAACDSGRCVITTAAACPPGNIPQHVCIACGPAGGCAQESDCARPCRQDSDCGVNQTRCLEGVCQVQGCI